MSHTEINKILLAIVDEETTKSSFIHSLVLSYRYKGELDILDMRCQSEKIERCGVREYLERWKILPENSPRSSVATLGMRIKKIIKTGNKINIIKNRINKYSYDLLIVGCRGPADKKGIFSSSLSSYIFNSFQKKILFIPLFSRPFIEEESGNISLQRVIIPFKNRESLSSSIAFLLSLLEVFREIKIELILFHIGAAFPSISSPVHPQIANLKEVLIEEERLEEITKRAEEYRGDLVILEKSESYNLKKGFFEKLLKNLSSPILLS
ncbi:MAG: universal stress protein [Chitinispirillaceae bacterium]|nr:universal stress protein [Chitinispirillaceae bacterium]